MSKRIFPVLKAGIIVGTLDILSAFLYFYLATGKNPLFIFLYIASALLGPAAFSGGAAQYAAGLLLHYLIACAFTIFFFWLYPRFKIQQRNPIATGIFYGLFIWIIMNLAVVPLSRIGKFPGSASGIFINAAILILVMGIPLSFMARRYYRSKTIRIH